MNLSYILMFPVICFVLYLIIGQFYFVYFTYPKLVSDCSKNPGYEYVLGKGCDKTFEQQCLDAGGKYIVSYENKDCIK